MLRDVWKAFPLTAADLTTVRRGFPLILQSWGWTYRVGNVPVIVSGPLPTMTGALGLGSQNLSSSPEASWGGREKSVALGTQAGQTPVKRLREMS